MAKQRLVENFSTDWKEPLNIRRLPLQEAVDKKIVQEGKEYTAKSKYEIPVWRLGKKNLNNRVYRESLGKRIEKICKEVVTANLADHPEEDGSVKDILAVSRNPHVREGILYVDTVIVDEVFEKKLEKMIEAGYGLGVSSSVLGDVDDDGNVIDESVEVERFFDFVLSPSYSVYVTEDCRIQTESLENTKEAIKENITIINKESIPMADNKMQILSEKLMKENLATIIKDAENKETIADKIAALEEAASYVSDTFLPDVKTQIDEKIVSLQKEALVFAEKGKIVEKLNEDIQTKETEKTSLQEAIVLKDKEIASLQEKYDASCKLLDETKEYANNAVTLLEVADAEAGSKFSAKEYLELVEANDSISKKLESEIANKLVLSKKIESFEKTNKDLKEKIDTLQTKYSKLKEDYDTATYVPPEAEDDVDVYNNDGEEFDYEDYLVDEPIEDELELDVTNDSDVEDYYNDLVDSNPAYESVKEDILRCKTLIEAQKTAMRLGKLIEKTPARKPVKKISEGADVRSIMPKG